MLRSIFPSIRNQAKIPVLSSLPIGYSGFHSSNAIKKKHQGDNSCAVVLCGCGYLDGTEISEAISISIHLHQNGLKPCFYAPNIQIIESFNHLTNQTDKISPIRCALNESARICRSDIKPLNECDPCKHAGIILPGGMGVVKTMSNFAQRGADCVVLPELVKLVEGYNFEKKPIGAMCIAPVLMAKIFKGCRITLGKQCPEEKWPHAKMIQHCEKLGAKIEMKDVNEIAQCETFNIISTPGWMSACTDYGEVHEGTGKMISCMKNLMITCNKKS